MPHAARQPRSWLIFDVRREGDAAISEKVFESAPQVSSNPVRDMNCGMRNVFPIRSESVSRFPSPGIVKYASADRLPDMCSQGGPQVIGTKHAFDSVQQFHVCVSPNKAPEPTP